MSMLCIVILMKRLFLTFYVFGSFLFPILLPVVCGRSANVLDCNPVVKVQLHGLAGCRTVSQFLSQRLRRLVSAHLAFVCTARNMIIAHVKDPIFLVHFLIRESLMNGQ